MGIAWVRNLGMEYVDLNLSCGLPCELWNHGNTTWTLRTRKMSRLSDMASVWEAMEQCHDPGLARRRLESSAISLAGSWSRCLRRPVSLPQSTRWALIRMDLLKYFFLLAGMPCGGSTCLIVEVEINPFWQQQIEAEGVVCSKGHPCWCSHCCRLEYLYRWTNNEGGGRK